MKRHIPWCEFQIPNGWIWEPRATCWLYQCTSSCAFRKRQWRPVSHTISFFLSLLLRVGAHEPWRTSDFRVHRTDSFLVEENMCPPPSQQSPPFRVLQCFLSPITGKAFYSVCDPHGLDSSALLPISNLISYSLYEPQDKPHPGSHLFSPSMAGNSGKIGEIHTGTFQYVRFDVWRLYAPWKPWLNRKKHMFNIWNFDHCLSKQYVVWCFSRKLCSPFTIGTRQSGGPSRKTTNTLSYAMLLRPVYQWGRCMKCNLILLPSSFYVPCSKPIFFNSTDHFCIFKLFPWVPTWEVEYRMFILFCLISLNMIHYSCVHLSNTVGYRTLLAE